MNKANIIKLDNGLRIALLKISEAYSVSLSVVVLGGSKYEDSSTLGAAHFFEHMLLEGTKKYPTSKSLSLILEKVGGKNTAWTDKDYVQYSVRIPKGNYQVGLEYLSQILFSPALLNEAIEMEKNIITEEYNRKVDNSEVEAWELFMKNTFGQDTYMGRSILGTPEGIRKLNKKKLSKFLNKFYNPNNMVLVVAGNLQEAQMLDDIKQHFGSVGQKKDITTLKSDIKTGKGKLFFELSSDIQSQIVLGFITGVRISDDDLWTLRVIRNILGFGIGSRILQELVYKTGLVYSTNVWSISYEDTGIFNVTAGSAHKNAKLAIETILNEFKKLKEVPISKDELKSAINGEVAEEYYSHDNLETLASTTSLQLALENKIYTIEDIEKKLRRVTDKKILQVAKKYFTKERLKALILGNVSEKDKESMRNIVENFS